MNSKEMKIEKSNGLTTIRIGNNYSWLEITISDYDVITVRTYCDGGMQDVDYQLSDEEVGQFLQVFSIRSGNAS